MKVETATLPIEKNLIGMANLVLQLTFAAVLFCVFFNLSVDSKPFEINDDAVCGYESCPVVDPDAINVHLIPHSHDDVGWLKTYDQYYYQDVQNVISSVVVSLKQNPERRFVQVETAYFKKWWEVQPESIQQDVINLVNNGQFEIIGGAWSMNDEAAVHYQSTIDQFTFGFRYLEDRLGKCSRPRVGWQIDPFGHSREQASISAQLGFDGLFFARIDYRDKDNRRKNKNLDMLWRGSSNLGNTSDIFTMAFSGHYSAPRGFCFDIVCSDAPIIDDKDSPDYNYEDRVKDFANFIQGEHNIFATNNILVTLGDDFRYQAALQSYINYDRLIEGFKLFEQNIDGKRINVFYSTPSCYAKAVNDFANTNNYELQMKTDDFFPYADGPNTYWTGYFTSRPASKRYEREGNNLLQVTKQLLAALNVPYENEQLTSLKEAVGIMQHHDAITGTEKQHVTNNYHLLLTEGLKNAAEASGYVLSALISGEDTGGANTLELDSCLLANISSCPQTESNIFTVVVYNPLSREVSTPISLPIDGSKLWIVLDNTGKEVEHDIEPTITDFNYADGISTSSSTLVFVAKDLPALGYKVYQFQSAGGYKAKSTKPEKVPQAFGYDDTNFSINDVTGSIDYVTMNGITVAVYQDLLYYTSQDTSGAYIFVPTDSEPERIVTGAITVTPFEGDVSRGIIQDFGGWAKQIIRVYNDDRNYIEIDWIIGPINIDKGKEVVSRFYTSLENEGVFYTDSNGREMIKRTRNSRPDYEYTNEQPVSGNYYPINSKIVMKDEKNGIELAILTDRSEGGSSILDGELQIMLHRACHHDDYRGVGENLNEQEYGQGIVVRGKHYLVLGPSEGNGKKSMAAIERDIAQRKLLAPWPFISNKDLTTSLKNLQFTNLKQNLPDNVQILTLEPWKENTLLLRLEHVLEKNEDPTLSQDVTVDLSDLFNSFTITELRETTLGGNIPIEENVRLSWPGSPETAQDSEILNGQNRAARDVDDLTITLAPMQIRTFLATVTYNI